MSVLDDLKNIFDEYHIFEEFSLRKKVLGAVEPLEKQLAAIKQPEFLEKLAELEHEQWSHWILYQQKFCNPTETKAVWNYDHWNRWLVLSQTPYNELTEEQKESDRKWAKKVLGLLEEKQKK